MEISPFAMVLQTLSKIELLKLFHYAIQTNLLLHTEAIVLNFMPFLGLSLYNLNISFKQFWTFLKSRKTCLDH